MEYVKVFSDENMRTPISTIRKEDFVRAGTPSDKIVIYVKNVSRFELASVEFFADDIDLKIEPQRIGSLQTGQSVALTVIWYPSSTRETPLNATLSIRADVVKRV